MRPGPSIDHLVRKAPSPKALVETIDGCGMHAALERWRSWCREELSRRYAQAKRDLALKPQINSGVFAGDAGTRRLDYRTNRLSIDTVTSMVTGHRQVLPRLAA